MIVGTGIDIEKINRVTRLIDEHAARLDRIFTPRERAFCESGSSRLRLARYTAAFAAKEAVMKALGTGWVADVTWMEIDTPTTLREGVVLHGATARFAESQKVGSIIISVSTTRETVVATAVAESVNSAMAL